MPDKDSLNDEGLIIYRCPRCKQEVIDDWELAIAHLKQCEVNCKTCADFATSMLDKNGNCYYCGGYQKWRERSK